MKDYDIHLAALKAFLTLEYQNVMADEHHHSAVARIETLFNKTYAWMYDAMGTDKPLQSGAQFQTRELKTIARDLKTLVNAHAHALN